MNYFDLIMLQNPYNFIWLVVQENYLSNPHVSERICDYVKLYNDFLELISNYILERRVVEVL